ncbi:NAD-dependent epimerase/dehydratase family protein [Geomonas agri]|uniref:NAD-dependent epimerase/dehydratase family protein n=1 Tax=Geomonas agri TaxID=2873702 RepID=UPI001CD533F3|nr:NAD-dependent epimerase/dehydratase family protein [Geomonas agri]
MNILIDGATGFLGGKVTTMLVELGHDVSIIKRTSSNTTSIDHIRNCKFYDIDTCDKETIFSESSKFDVVIHLATDYGRAGNGFSGVIQANLMLPLELMSLSVKYGVEFFINTDTYYNRPGSQSYHLAPYSLTKRQIVEWGKLLAVQKKLHFINVKLQHMFGAGEGASKFTTSLIRDCVRDVDEVKLTDGIQRRDFIYIDDVVAAYKTILLQLPYDDFFVDYDVGTGISTSIRDFALLVKKATKTRTHLNFGAIPNRENEITDSCADTTLLRSLGWTAQVELEEGVDRIIQYETISKYNDSDL